jgi:superfamily II DNA or RNA helicase
MKDVVTIRIPNEVDAYVIGLKGTHLEFFINKHSVFTKNYFFNPKYKLGRWDGKISHFSKAGRTYLYLLPEILSDLVKFGYQVELDDSRIIYPVFPDPIDENIFADILHPDTNKPLILRDYQVEAVNAVLHDSNGTILAATGAGKALSLTSKILTPTGWILNRDICVGSQVITPDNSISTVLGVYPQYPKQLYTVTFHDGSSVDCCVEHLWYAYIPNNTQLIGVLLTTQHMLDFCIQSPDRTGNIGIPLCDAIEFAVSIVKLDPYVLGVFIGTCVESISSLMTSIDDDFVLVEVINRTDTIGTMVQYIDELQLNCTSNNTFIPYQYKSGSISQRWDIIRGLMDIGGIIHNQEYMFNTNSNQLACDIQEVIWSLGGICVITSRELIHMSSDVVYTCSINVIDPTMLFNTPIKLGNCNHHNVKLLRNVVSVIPTKIDQSQCIMIDHPDHLYITDNYIVTHNTIICAAILHAYTKFNIKSITIVPDQNLIMQTKKTYIGCNLDIGEYSGKHKDIDHQHVVSTWQALQHNHTLIHGFDLVIVDECHNLSGDVLKTIICDHAATLPYRFGVTGTLPKEPINALAVKISVGPVKYEIPAHVLIDRGVLAKLDIVIIQLEENLVEQYNQYVIDCIFNKPVSYSRFKEQYFPEFSAEKSYLQYNDTRIKWIADKLMDERDVAGNVLCLVSSIPIARKLTALIPNAICINGQDVKDPKKRQEVYDLFEVQDGLIVIATVHIAGTGLSINRIFSLFSVDIGRSFTRVIQAIGRGLRKAPDKHSVTFYDICCDLKRGKTHLNERMQYYKESKYPHTVKKIKYN